MLYNTHKCRYRERPDVWPAHGRGSYSTWIPPELEQISTMIFDTVTEQQRPRIQSPSRAHISTTSITQCIINHQACQCGNHRVHIGAGRPNITPSEVRARWLLGTREPYIIDVGAVVGSIGNHRAIYGKTSREKHQVFLYRLLKNIK